MAFRAFFPNELADLQHTKLANHPGAEHQRKQQSRDACQRGAHRNVAKYIERVKIALEHVIKKIQKHLSRAPWTCRAPRMPPAPRSSAQNGRRALRRCAPSL